MSDEMDEWIIAYLDGEMPERDRLAFEKEIDEDPELAEAVSRHRDVLARLHAAYPRVSDKVFSEAELAAFGLAGKSLRSTVELRSRPAENRRSGGRSPLWWTALAASLVLGIAIGRFGTADDPLLVERDGQLVASARLDKALDILADNTEGPVRIGLSFRDDAGLCRTFELDTGVSGIACKSDAGWSVPMLSHGASSSPAGDFRLAGGDFPASVMREVDSRIVGAPLTPAEVEEARRNHWRRRP